MQASFLYRFYLLFMKYILLHVLWSQMLKGVSAIILYLLMK